MGHQIKGGPTLLLTASVQVCNWTEQRADTMTPKERTWSDCPDIYDYGKGLLLQSTSRLIALIMHFNLNLLTLY